MLSRGNRSNDWPKRRTLARSVRTSRNRERPGQNIRGDWRSNRLRDEKRARLGDKNVKQTGRADEEIFPSAYLDGPGSKFLVKNWEKQKKGKGAKKKEEKRKKGKKRDGIQTAELDRRDQVTATNSWPNFLPARGVEVENQVAAPTESSTPNLHRATIAQQRVRMEEWRQRRLGSMGTIWKKKK
jgi:hypothetical protein